MFKLLVSVPLLRRLLIGLPALLAAASASAQTITTGPAAAAAPVPLNHPAALALVALALGALGAWALRTRQGGAVLRALGVTAIGLGLLAAAGFSPSLRAAMPTPLLQVFTASGGETLAIPIQRLPSSGTPTDFLPVQFTNQAGSALRVSAVTPPAAVTACFPAGVPSPLPSTALPTGATACAAGTLLQPGAACTVNVAALCAQTAAQAPLAALTVSPASLTLYAGTATTGVATVTNTSATVTATNVAAQLPSGAAFTLQASTCGASLAPGASCTLTFAPGAAVQAAQAVAIAGSNTNIVTVQVAQQSPLATLSVSPTNLALIAGTATTGTVTVTNTSARYAVNVTAALPSGADFTLSGSTCSALLAPSASCTLTFAPGTSVQAAQAVSIAGDNTNTVTVQVAQQLGIGSAYGGGIVFSIAGSTVKIASTVDNSTGIIWSTLLTPTGAISDTDGAANTSAIVALLGGGSYAARVCSDLVSGGYTDWYLPAKNELQALYQSAVVGGGFGSNAWYWSSTETSSSYAFLMNGLNEVSEIKLFDYYVRCIRTASL